TTAVFVVATPLHSLFDAVRHDPDVRRSFVDTPSTFLAEHGWSDLESDDLEELLRILADGLPEQQATVLARAADSLATDDDVESAFASTVAGTVDSSIGVPSHDLDPHDVLDREPLDTGTPDPDIDTDDVPTADTDSPDPDTADVDTDTADTADTDTGTFDFDIGDHDLFDDPVDIELATSETVEPIALFPDDGQMWDDF
ncbi:MAG: hypothetical protein ACO307_04010, partial [Ilumatobacteraceae bacterium]